MQNERFDRYATLLSDLSRILPEPGQPREIHHNGKIIPIELEHLGVKGLQTLIRMGPVLSVIVNVDHPLVRNFVPANGEINEAGIRLVACTSYALYLTGGPLLRQKVEQQADYLASALRWERN